MKSVLDSFILLLFSSPPDTYANVANGFYSNFAPVHFECIKRKPTELR